MLKKYKYDELMIEITRKCNMKCAYCLRGDAQNVTMSKEVIDKIFEDAVDCKQVLFTGGEPLLALDEIEYFVDKILKSNWTTKNIAMTINGMIRDKRLIDIVNRFCQSKEERTFYVFVSEDADWPPLRRVARILNSSSSLPLTSQLILMVLPASLSLKSALPTSRLLLPFLVA